MSDDQERYKVYKKYNARCHHCGTKLEWDAYEVRGRSGGWVLELAKESDAIEDGAAFCYKCFEFEGRDKSGKLLTTYEP